METVTGKRIDGILLKTEERSSGFELFLSTENGQIHYIPYHAIADITLPKAAIPTSIEMLPNL